MCLEICSRFIHVLWTLVFGLWRIRLIGNEFKILPSRVRLFAWDGLRSDLYCLCNVVGYSFMQILQLVRLFQEKILSL